MSERASDRPKEQEREGQMDEAVVALLALLRSKGLLPMELLRFAPLLFPVWPETGSLNSLSIAQS